jgi:MoaA/NifB/PqqE/SkfB family radical SAM enzyme
LAFAINKLVVRKEQPYVFILVLNDKCNLNCFYCESKNTGRYDLDWNTARTALKEAYDRGSRVLIITGGEPMLWTDGASDIRDVVDYARGIGFLEITVFTNGTFPLTIPDCTYIVTVDGTEATHNAIRAGTYSQVIKNVRRARSKVLASMTISKANHDELENAVLEITETGVFGGITFNLLTHSPEIVAQYGLSGERRAAVLDRMWQLKRKGFPIILSRAAYRALRGNHWRRPVKEIELFAGHEFFTCCRDVGHPEICEKCGYTSCAEISQALAGRPSAVVELLKCSGPG